MTDDVPRYYTINAVGFANGVFCPHAGEWLKSFDHDAFDGQGYGEFTSDISQAMRFPSRPAALEFWAKQSSVRPLRDDGMPNKPFTALSVLIEEYPS